MLEFHRRTINEVKPLSQQVVAKYSVQSQVKRKLQLQLLHRVESTFFYEFIKENSVSYILPSTVLLRS